ncbi:MAG: hypothetical protein B5M53_02250 [Candidatus Cloacimonas sp. 4484_209]|nr:MAG: hypothetical protein B5M53_02250 [Candidatus Cloacimonas sp. 4484_209]
MKALKGFILHPKVFERPFIKRKIYNVICFSFMPWSNMWKRNQSMMAEIAKFDFIDKVIFVNPDISIRRIFTRKSKNSNISLGISSKLLPFKRTSKIWEYTPVCFVPFRKYFTKLEKIETQIMLKIIRRLNSNMPYILFMNCPNIFLHYLLDELLENAELSIFDFSDDFVELVHSKKSKDFFLCNIMKYAKAADIVLTVNNHLKTKYAFLNKNIYVIRNATNYYNFNRVSYKSIDFLEKIKSKKMPILGYSGVINMSRIDFDLLDFLLKKRPNWQYVFIGLADSHFTRRYLQHKNVHHLPPVDYQSLPDYIHYFDVAIVPFKINEHTKGNDLLKFYDYLAMGKPIVSTEIGGAEDLRDVISIAQGPSDFLEKIEKALINNASEDILKRKNVALENSWHKRVKELEELIKKSLGI